MRRNTLRYCALWIAPYRVIPPYGLSIVESKGLDVIV